MKHILFIEDEAFIASVYRERLCSEGFSVDVAADGRSGLEMFRSRKPDLVLLDLMLPQTDGIEVLKTIRSVATAKQLPVLVFTNAFLGGMVQAAWEAGASQVLTKSNHTPRQVVDMIKVSLEEMPAYAEPDADLRLPEIDREARDGLLEDAPRIVAALRQTFDALAKEPKNPTRLQDLYAQVRPLAATAARAGLHPVARMAEALEGLLKVLSEKTDSVTLSVLLTITQAIDTAEYLFDNLDAVALRDPSQARILVVDDDEFARRAVCAALAKANLKATCVADPAAALQEHEQGRFDLAFVDIEMPDADGYGLCTILRGVPTYQETPIIFLSLHADHEHRKESFVRGGNDFISKPFLYMELAVKALSFVLRGSWDNSEPGTHAAARVPLLGQFGCVSAPGADSFESARSRNQSGRPSSASPRSA